MPDIASPTEPMRHSAVVAHIGRRIVGGQFAPGEILPREEEFVEQLSVGRSVVREALRVLASKGLIESRQRRGTQVLPEGEWLQLDPDVLAWRMNEAPTARFLRDLVDLRAMIEPAASALAATRATNTELALIQSLARELQHTESNDQAFIEADMRFHRAVLEAAHNDVLLQVGSAIESGLRLSRQVTVTMGHSSRVAEHIDAANAIASRSSHKASQAMARLIDYGTKDITTVLGEEWFNHGEER